MSHILNRICAYNNNKKVSFKHYLSQSNWIILESTVSLTASVNTELCSHNPQPFSPYTSQNLH